MKKIFKFTDHKGKTTETEINLRNVDHFEIQKNTRAQVFKPKKGKGSFKRDKKVEEN